MQYVVCIVSLAPLRVSPDHRSEMSSQLLFGETAFVQQKNEEGWLYVSCTWDGYEGWCRENQFEEINSIPLNYQVAGGWVNKLSYKDRVINAPFGSVIFNNEILNDDVKLLPGFTKQTISGEILQEISLNFLHTTYCWGGRSVFGIDCSGFVQMVYKMANIPLLRDARLQAEQGRVVHLLQEVRCGDLAFFEEQDGLITHVGMLLNEKEIIHASGEVRIDHIDNEGIVRRSDGVRTHRLRIIKRVL